MVEVCAVFCYCLLWLDVLKYVVCMCKGCDGCCVFVCIVVVVRLPRPMEGNGGGGGTPIFKSLQNCQFHHRRLESLEHFNVLYIYIYILSTTVSHFWTLRMSFFLQGLTFLYTFPILQVHFACLYYNTWSCRCSCMGSMSVVMQMLYVSVHAVAVHNAAFCMTCSLLMLVEDARGDHMEEAYYRTGLMTAL